MDSLRWFILNENHSVTEVTIEEFSRHRSSEDKFFGMDHRLIADCTCLMDNKEGDQITEDIAVLFGTMSIHGEEQMWSTYEKAMEGHRIAVEKAKSQQIS